MLTSTTVNVERTVLDNGLTVLIKENHAAPVVAVFAHVNIGYFNEPDRWNGIAHVVEHMFFKGTRRRPGKEQIAGEVRALGGSINAGTYYDETTYYIVVPGRHLAQAVELQADTFTGGLFDPEELAKEIEVIIQESKQKRDNPGALLRESLYARAYDRHRLRRWRIGPDEVLRALRSEDLREFVEQTYRPENIILTIVGDVDAGQARESIAQHWSGMPRGTLHREPSPQESERAGFRYYRMRGAIRQRLFDVCFHAPPLLHADAAPLMVLGALLSDGRSSRLYRALKEDRRLVQSVWAGYEGFEDLGIFTLGGETTGEDPLPAEEALFEETRRMHEEGIGDEELLRVKTRMQSRRLYLQEDVLGMARNLASYEALGSYHLADEMLARLQAVTATDIRRVMAAYLDPHRAALMEYLPQEAGAPERATEEVLQRLAPHATGKSPLSAAPRSVMRPEAERTVTRLPSGASLLFQPRHDLPLVAIQILFPGGKRMETPENAGITNLMLRSAMKGTASYSAVEIAFRIESLGSGIGMTAAPDYYGFSMKLLADRLPEGWAVLKEVLTRPLFPTDEVEKEKQTLYGEMRRQRDSMYGRALDLFNMACYGTQPYGLPSIGREEAITALSAADLEEWHRRGTHGGGAVIAVVGDIELNRLLDLVAEALPAGAPEPVETPPARPLPPGEQVERVARQQTAAVMGFPGAPIASDDRHALDVIAEIASGLAGRFFKAVRGENALAYAVTGYHRTRRDAGNFITYTATSPEKEQQAREILLGECERLEREPVEAKELADAREAIRGEHIIGTQTFHAQASEMAIYHLYGLPPDGPQQFLERIDAVTAEEIQTAAARYLQPDRIWLGVVRGGENGAGREQAGDNHPTGA